MLLVGELVLYFANVVATEEFEGGHLVVPRGAGSCDEDDNTYGGKHIGEGLGNLCHPFPFLSESQQLDVSNGKAHRLDDGFSEHCHKSLHEYEQENPSHIAEDDGR